MSMNKSLANVTEFVDNVFERHSLGGLEAYPTQCGQ